MESQSGPSKHTSMKIESIVARYHAVGHIVLRDFVSFLHDKKEISVKNTAEAPQSKMECSHLKHLE